MKRVVTIALAAAAGYVIGYVAGERVGRVVGTIEGSWRAWAAILRTEVDASRAWQDRVARMSYRELRQWRRRGRKADA